MGIRRASEKKKTEPNFQLKIDPGKKKKKVRNLKRAIHWYFSQVILLISLFLNLENYIKCQYKQFCNSKKH